MGKPKRSSLFALSQPDCENGTPDRCPVVSTMRGDAPQSDAIYNFSNLKQIDLVS